MSPWTAAHQASLSITNSWSLLKFMSTESVMRSNHLILCHPLLLLPSIFLSIRIFSNDSAFPIRLGQCPGSYERSIEAWSSGPQSWSPPGLCQAVPRPPSQTEFVCVIPSLSSFCVHSVGWKEQKASGTACGSKGSRRGGGFQSPMTLDLPLF